MSQCHFAGIYINKEEYILITYLPHCRLVCTGRCNGKACNSIFLPATRHSAQCHSPWTCSSLHTAYGDSWLQLMNKGAVKSTRTKEAKLISHNPRPALSRASFVSWILIWRSLFTYGARWCVCPSQFFGFKGRRSMSGLEVDKPSPHWFRPPSTRFPRIRF